MNYKGIEIVVKDFLDDRVFWVIDQIPTYIKNHVLAVSARKGYMEVQWENSTDPLIRRQYDAHSIMAEDGDSWSCYENPNLVPIEHTYYEYLHSSEWNEKRRRALRRAKRKCQVCGEKYKKLNVHHNTYDNIRDEPPEDLVVLCEDCHKLFHGIK